MNYKKQKTLSDKFINSINTDLFQIFQMKDYPQNNKHWYVRFKHDIPYEIKRNEDEVGTENIWYVWKVEGYSRECILEVSNKGLEKAVKYCYKKHLREIKSEMETIETLLGKWEV